MSPRPTRTARPVPAAQKALWGRQEPLPVVKPAPAGSNDLELFASIVRTALEPGYVVIGPTDKPFIREPGSRYDVNAVPRYEADAIAQMLATGHLRIGGNHHVTHGDREGPARSLLVPASTRSMVRRWDALHRLPQPRLTTDNTWTTPPPTTPGGHR